MYGRRANRGGKVTITKNKSQPQQRIYPKVDPSEFVGSAGWMLLHSSATTYDGSPEMKRGFKKLLEGIQSTFSCPNCRKHFAINLRKYRFEDYSDNRDDLFLFTYLLHDEVNKAKGVKSPPLDKIKRYFFESLGVVCTKGCGTN